MNIEELKKRAAAGDAEAQYKLREWLLMEQNSAELSHGFLLTPTDSSSCQRNWQVEK